MNSIEDARNALGVITKDLKIRAWLSAHDPMALAQADEAFAALEVAVDDRSLALWFTPDAIRDHYDGEQDDPTVGLTDEDLREVGEWALASDSLYTEFHDNLQQCLAVKVEQKASKT